MADLPELPFQEVVRIGSEDDPDEGFSNVTALRVAPNGDVLVLENQAQEIRAFSSEGERLRTFGRRGEGPGEFTVVSDLDLLGDTLRTYDPARARITWFTLEGEVLFTTPIERIPVESPVPGLALSVAPYRPTPDGYIESSLNRMYQSSGSSRAEPYDYPVVRFDRAGRVVDTLRWDRWESSGPTWRVGDQEFFAPVLAPGRPLEVDRRGYRFVLDWTVPVGEEDGRLEVVRMSAEGDSLYRTVLRYPPEPLPRDHVLDSLTASPVRAAPVFGLDEVDVRRAVEGAIELPDFRPPVRSARPGEDGSLWIQMNASSDEGARWVLLGPEGEPRGTLTLPMGFRVSHHDGTVVWGIERDALDIPWVVRLELSSGA